MLKCRSEVQQQLGFLGPTSLQSCWKTKCQNLLFRPKTIQRLPSARPETSIFAAAIKPRSMNADPSRIKLEMHTIRASPNYSVSTLKTNYLAVLLGRISNVEARVV